jgi:hypothetical protein
MNTVYPRSGPPGPPPQWQPPQAPPQWQPPPSKPVPGLAGVQVSGCDPWHEIG